MTFAEVRSAAARIIRARPAKPLRGRRSTGPAEQRLPLSTVTASDGKVGEATEDSKEAMDKLSDRFHLSINFCYRTLAGY